MTKKLLKKLFEGNQFEVLSIEFLDENKTIAWVTVRDTLDSKVYRRYTITDSVLECKSKFYDMDCIIARYWIFGVEDIFEGKLVL